jgi:hypothetical protein
MPSGDPTIERGPESLAELFFAEVLKANRIDGSCQGVSASRACEHDVDATCLDAGATARYNLPFVRSM